MVRSRQEAKIHRIWPAWVRSVGAMQQAMAEDPELRVQAMCGKCNTAFTVDLDALARAYGPRFSLINQHGKCKRPRCGGRAVFQYSAGPTTPFQTMTEL